MAIILTGTYQVILSTTIVGVALPAIGRDFGQSGGLEWVITAYLLAVAAAQLATGWLADRLGRRTVFLSGLGLFVAASVAVALSPSMPVLIAMRAIQGFGGIIMPVGLAMIYELFPPHRRGTAMGIWGIAAMAAPAMGPVLGGYLVDTASWRWTFLINVPIGIVGLVVGWRFLRDVGYRERRPLDVRGWVLSALGLLLTLVGVSRGNAWGWDSPATLLVLGTGLGLLVVFVRHALRSAHPIIDLRIFKVGTFRITMFIVALVTVIQFGRLVFIPLELQSLRGLSALETGEILAPAALGAMIAMPLGGRLTDRVGSRTPVLMGLALLGTAAWFLAHLDLDTPQWQIIVFLVLQGLGTGFAVMPNTVAAMNAIPQRLLAQGSALRSLNRQVAGAVGVAALSAFLVAQIGSVSAEHATVGPAQAQAAYNDIFLIALGAVVVAFVLALRLPGRPPARAPEGEPGVVESGAATPEASAEGATRSGAAP